MLTQCGFFFSWRVSRSEGKDALEGHNSAIGCSILKASKDCFCWIRTWEMLLNTGSTWAAASCFMDVCINHIRDAFEMHEEVHLILKLLAQKSFFLEINFTRPGTRLHRLFLKIHFKTFIMFYFFLNKKLQNNIPGFLLL